MLKNLIFYNFVPFNATRKVRQPIYFFSSSFWVVIFRIIDGKKSGSGIRDNNPGSATLPPSVN
jgi:hypothetical protein